MAKFNFTDFVFSLGGNDISGEVHSIGGLRQEVPTEPSHGAGDSDSEHTSAGITMNDDMTLEGMFDDTALFPAALMRAAVGTTLAFVITIGGTKTRTGNAIVSSFEEAPARDVTTKYTAVLRPTGNVALA